MHDEMTYTVEQVADILGISNTSVYNWARSGALKAEKLDGKWAIKEKDLVDYISQRPRVYGYLHRSLANTHQLQNAKARIMRKIRQKLNKGDQNVSSKNARNLRSGKRGNRPTLGKKRTS